MLDFIARYEGLRLVTRLTFTPIIFGLECPMRLVLAFACVMSQGFIKDKTRFILKKSNYRSYFRNPLFVEAEEAL